VVCLGPTATTCMPRGHRSLCDDAEYLGAIEKAGECPICNTAVDEMLEAEKAATTLHRQGKRVDKS
jgi:hypothetical protein